MSRKGPQFEREFSRRLSLWWSGGEEDDLFWRTQASGGRATVRHRLGRRTAGHYGDVCAVDGRGEPLTDLVTIELKRGRHHNATVHDLLDRGPAQRRPPAYGQFFAQARAAAKRAGTPYWMLIHCRDRRVPFCFYPGALHVNLIKKGAYPFHLPFEDTYPIIFLNLPGARYPTAITGMRLDSFFAGVAPDQIRSLAREV